MKSLRTQRIPLTALGACIIAASLATTGAAAAAPVITTTEPAQSTTAIAEPGAATTGSATLGDALISAVRNSGSSTGSVANWVLLPLICSFTGGTWRQFNTLMTCAR